MIRNIFVNAVDGRLRAGWRIALFLVAFFGLSALGMVSVRTAMGGLPKTSPIIFGILAVSATLATFLARRFLDKRPFLSLGLTNPRTAWQDLLFGFVLSGVMAGIVFAAMAGLGYIDNIEITAAGFSVVTLLAMPLLLTVLIGYWEELVFRGYLLQNMADGMGTKWAVVVSCLLYGAVHAANPNAGLLSTLIIVLFGYLRIYGFLATRLLWLSIGMHIGWNFFQGPVFGYAASGHVEEQTLISHDSSAAAWLSGGDFGPEASVLTIPVVLLALLAMRAWAGRGTAANS